MRKSLPFHSPPAAARRYSNIYGCEAYPGIYFAKNETQALGAAREELGGLRMYLCLHATDMPIFSATYWILFVLISALVVLSLFIGSVTMSMSEQMKEMREEEERLEAEAADLKAANKLLEAAKEAEKQKAAEPASAEASTRRRGLREREEHQRQLEMQKLLLELVQDDGAAHVTTTLDDETPAPACVAAYSKLAELSKRAVENSRSSGDADTDGTTSTGAARSGGLAAADSAQVEIPY